ncbi:hypothetical protein [Brevibacterium casei]
MTSNDGSGDSDHSGRLVAVTATPARKTVVCVELLIADHER